MRNWHRAAVLAAVLAIAGCGQSMEQKAASGGLGGAAVGALVAGPIGALSGAAVGGASGVVAEKAEEDRRVERR